MVYDVDGNLICGKPQISYSDTECRTAFVSEMTKKANMLGMSNSFFDNPSGYWRTNLSTAKDAARLAIACCGSDKLAKVWGKKSYTITTKNDTRETIQLTTSVQAESLENYYVLLGGKTGAMPTVNTFNLVAVCVVEGRLVVGSIGGATTGEKRFTAMKQLMDIAKTIINGGTNSATVTDALYAACALLPTYNTNLFEQFDFNWIYEQSGDTQYSIASVSKCLAMLVMLDWCTDIHDTFTFVESDLVGGTGAVFAEGDVISFDDALYAAMLPSSNMAVQAVARVLGNKILNDNGGA